MIAGAVVRDGESGHEFKIHARAVINATGCFSDGVRRLADPNAAPMIAPSQGVHLVFDGSFLRGETAIMVPHTSDGRVMFAIPWHGHTLVGTTDTAIDSVSLEPVPFEQEIEFILDTAGKYLTKPPGRSDILSDVGRNPAAGEIDEWGFNSLAFARPFHSHRPERTAHSRWRQMDHLSAYGGRRRDPGGGPGWAGGA